MTFKPIGIQYPGQPNYCCATRFLAGEEFQIHQQRRRRRCCWAVIHCRGRQQEEGLQPPLPPLVPKHSAHPSNQFRGTAKGLSAPSLQEMLCVFRRAKLSLHANFPIFNTVPSFCTKHSSSSSKQCTAKPQKCTVITQMHPQGC